MPVNVRHNLRTLITWCPLFVQFAEVRAHGGTLLGYAENLGGRLFMLHFYGIPPFYFRIYAKMHSLWVYYDTYECSALYKRFTKYDVA